MVQESLCLGMAQPVLDESFLSTTNSLREELRTYLPIACRISMRTPWESPVQALMRGCPNYTHRIGDRCWRFGTKSGGSISAVSVGKHTRVLPLAFSVHLRSARWELR